MNETVSNMTHHAQGSEIIEGILVIDKPGGITSFDVVYKIRKELGIKKVGHAGTLDPLASGVLVILLGSSTKLSATLTSNEKTYLAKMRLGIETDTHDRDGKVLAVKPLGDSIAEKISEAAECFRGEIEQVPPMFSAKKIRGKRLYRLARKGMDIPRDRVKVSIKELKIESVALPDVTLFIACSKGTYIRTLCHDMGRVIGPGAHMTELRRLSSGMFSLQDALTIEEVSRLRRAGTLWTKIIAPEAAGGS